MAEPIARNLCVSPAFPTGNAGEWRKGATGDTSPQVGGWDKVGNPLHESGLKHEGRAANALTVPIHGLKSGDTPQLWVEYEARFASGSLYVGFTKDRAAGHDESGFAFAIEQGNNPATYKAPFDPVTEDGPHWLYLELSSVNTGKALSLVQCRVDSQNDQRGIFHGDSEAPDEDHAYEWAGDPWASASQLVTVEAEPEPEPEPEPGPGVTTEQLVNNVRAMVGLGEGEDTDQLTQAVLTARLLVSAYTRGRGVTDEGVAPPLGAVVALAAMRLYANPTQLDNFIGSVGYRQGFTGWTLAERAVLNGYRRVSA